MNNLLSYCGLVDAKIRASDKDLPVLSEWNLIHDSIVPCMSLDMDIDGPNKSGRKCDVFFKSPKENIPKSYPDLEIQIYHQ